MDDVIRIDDKWYVLATSSRADDRTRVLKHGETFGLFDRHGDIQHIGIGEQGLYNNGTRFLSQFELSVNQRRPLLLNSTVKKDNSIMTVDLTTPDLYRDGKEIIAKGMLHIFRCKLLWQDVHYEHIRVHNYSDKPLDFCLQINVDSDYNDIFQVRGAHRTHSGEMLTTTYTENELCLGYTGLDNVTRHTRLLFSLPFQTDDGTDARFSLSLEPHQEQDLYISIACDIGDQKAEANSFQHAFVKFNKLNQTVEQKTAGIYTSNEQFNDWLNRAAADLNMLTTHTEHGPYPYAGIPWFSTPFGRDGIITALQYLWLYPEMARGVLAYLAATQASEVNAATDAQPGKILHEARRGEMAELGEIPFKQYYGTIDATPLFIMLADEYYKRTADRPFIESIWPNIERALEWIDHYGDLDGDGFIEYHRESPNGLLQQGWKDSNDSIFHADGTPARGPIALSEVQGYVYQAKKSAARFAHLFGEIARAEMLDQQAEELKKRFNECFWSEEVSTFVIALDGDKQPCQVRSSNAGHVLFSGIASDEYARRTAESLLSDSSFSGWGIRTIDKSALRYNPMSYHNGSIWPHDNAMIAIGLARYGYKDKAMQILTGLFDATIALDLNRLPELFCGFDRLPGQGPTLYPVACSPQAWASGAVFYILQACLGISFSPDKPQIRFKYPQLPDYIQRLQISNMRFGDKVIDLSFRRHPNDVGINVLRKEGDIDVAVYM